MNLNYPVFLTLKGKKCLVVGGGKVAERKVKTLLKCQAQVNVLSPELSANLRELVQKNRLKHIPRKYRPGDLKGFSLVFAATDDAEVNRKIFKEAKKRNLWLNVVDQPQLCTFQVPSIFERGDLKIAISTNGKSPALAKRLRKELEKSLGKEYATLLKFLGSLRAKLKKIYPFDEKKRKAILEKVVYSDLLEEIKKGEKLNLKEIEKWNF